MYMHMYIGGGRGPGLSGPANLKVLKNKIFWVGHNANLSTLGRPRPAGPPAPAAYVHVHVHKEYFQRNYPYINVHPAALFVPDYLLDLACDAA